MLAFRFEQWQPCCWRLDDLLRLLPESDKSKTTATLPRRFLEPAAAMSCQFAFAQPVFLDSLRNHGQNRLYPKTGFCSLGLISDELCKRPCSVFELDICFLFSSVSCCTQHDVCQVAVRSAHTWRSSVAFACSSTAACTS